MKNSTTFETPDYGYIVNGYYSSDQTSKVDRLEYSTETISFKSNMPEAIKSGAPVQNTSYGYICGGYNPTGAKSNIYKLDFSSEVVSDTNNNLPAEHYSDGNLVNGAPN